MKKMINLLALLVVLTSVSFNAAGQDSTKLEYKYKAGKTYRYKSLSSYDMVQEMNGQEMKMSGLNTSIVKMEVTVVSANGDMTSINSYDEMKTIIKNSMMDTTMEQKEMIGKRGRVIFSKYGIELKKEVLDTITTKGFSSGANTLLTMGLMRFSGHGVAAGVKWSANHIDTVKMGEGSTITNSQTEYSFIGTEQKGTRDCYKIAFVSKSETTGKMKQMGMDIFVEGTGDTSGFAWIDRNEAILVNKESNSTQEMTYAVTGQMKMSIPSTQTIKSTYTLVE
jgi:hypothetical protein